MGLLCYEWPRNTDDGRPIEETGVKKEENICALNAKRET